MASLIKNLEYNLISQTLICEELLNISIDKKKAIIENDVQKLQQFIIKENMLVGKNQKLEKKRIELFGDISSVMGNADISLKDIQLAIKGQEGEEELEIAKNNLLEILEKLKKINTQNEELIKMSMEYVDISINLMRNSGSQVFYDLAGNEINTVDRRMFDARQ